MIKLGTAKKAIAVFANISLLLNSFLPFLLAAPAYAEEPTPEPTPTEIQEVSPTPEVSPTITEVTPTDVEANITPTIEITSTPEATSIPTITEEPTITPEPTTTEAPRAPPIEENTATPAVIIKEEIIYGESDEITPTVTPTSIIVNNTPGTIQTSVVENNQTRTDLLNPQIFSDKADYHPTEIAIIKGSGFSPNIQYSLIVTSNDLNLVYAIIANSNGEFTYSYQLDGVYRPSYKVEIKDTTGSVITSTTFTDANVLSDISEDNFSFVVIPDTQNYVDNNPETYFLAQTNFISANKDSLNVAYVAHEGDIANTPNSTTYTRAKTAMDVIKNSPIKFGMLRGNHDSDSSLFNSYFGTSYTLSDGHFNSGNDNNYSLFTAKGQDYIVINLSYAPSSDVLSWANTVLSTYNTRKAIIVSHSILNGSGVFTTEGTNIFNSLKGNSNIFLMLCGHMHDGDGEARKTETGTNGNKIEILLADYQDRGTGLLRILEFVPASNQVNVKTYSVYNNSFETDANSQFTLSYGTTTTPTTTPTVTATPTPSSNWTAYNDSAWVSGQIETNITKYTITTGNTTGLLKNYTNGVNTPVTVTYSSNGSPTVQTASSYGGAETSPGTDAYNTFHEFTNMTGVLQYGSNSGWNVDVTFTGLNPDKEYLFATSANRDDSSYTDRNTRFTISDISSAINDSTNGVNQINNESVYFNTGSNKTSGYVARWINIKPGSDGDFTVRAEANDLSGQYKAYAFSVFKLQEISSGSTTPTITPTPTSAPTSGCITSKVNSSSDDVMEGSTSKKMYLDDNYLDTKGGSAQRWWGMRFQNITIPQGATITSANIIFTSANTTTATPIMDIYAENSDNALTFTSADSNLSNRSRTAPIVWNMTAWTSGSNYTSTDLTTPIQTIVNRSGWNSGNAIAILGLSRSTSDSKRTVAFDDNSQENQPTLSVCYSVASTITPTPTTIPTPTQTCGNGIIETTETCDDGDTTSSDGCSSTCTIESGWNCSTENPSVCNLICIPSTEVCDGVDNDCDSSIDEGVKNTYYLDNDSDLYGNANSSVQTCTSPTGYVSNNTDCNDTNSQINPSATEIYDDIDNNCNSQTDEGTIPPSDADDDGIADSKDNCPNNFNLDQKDVDNDKVGDVCDNCVNTANSNQSDDDHDGLGNACDVYNNYCGDGHLYESEECDDGNSTDGDGCDSSCEVEKKWTCTDETGQKSVCNPDKIDWCHCEPNGNCQTLNLSPSALQNAGHMNANGNPLHAEDYLGKCTSSCVDTDKDGVCDSEDNCPNDKNSNQSDSDDDGLGDICDSQTCGNLDKEGTEICDGTDGVGSHQSCDEECRLINLPYCGDETVNQETEQCDDGNIQNGDGCSATCQEELPSTAICGDGRINSQFEQCDGIDGVVSGQNFCTKTCNLIPIYNGSDTCPTGTIKSTYPIYTRTISSTDKYGKTINLTSGKKYLFEASGIYSVDPNNGNFADAGYTTSSMGWIIPKYGINGIGNDYAAHALLANLGDGMGVVNWGSYNPFHFYSKYFESTSSNVQFVIGDHYGDWFNTQYQNQTGMYDNSGSLNLKVYECKQLEIPAPKATISKTNNATGDLKPGDSVQYTIQIGILNNNINDFKVTDLLSNGIKYRVGSYSVTKNGLPYSITEPQYHSPGVWNLNNLSAGDTIVMTYIADISNDQQPGKYTDLAYASGIDIYNSNTVYAEANSDGKISDTFVGTDVTVNKSYQNTVSREVNKTEETTGSVLGVSTDEMPSTGASTLWLILSPILGIIGFSLMKKKKITTLLITILLISGLTKNVFAADSNLVIRLEEPKTPANTKDLELKFVTLDTQGGSITVKCLKKLSTDSGFSQFGSDIILTNGGNSASCLLNQAITDNGSYQFKVVANGIDSNIVNLEYKTVGPGTPDNYSKERFATCDYRIKFKTANDDGKTVKVEIYRADITSFTADNGSRVGEITIGSNQEYVFDNSSPDCSKTYYYAIRAFDNAGNGSNLVGDLNTIYINSNNTTSTVSSAIPVASNIPKEEIDQAKSDNQGTVLGVETPESKNLIVQTKSFLSEHKLFSVLLVVLIIIIINNVAKKIQKNKSKKRRK